MTPAGIAIITLILWVVVVGGAMAAVLVWARGVRRDR